MSAVLVRLMPLAARCLLQLFGSFDSAGAKRLDFATRTSRQAIKQRLDSGLSSLEDREGKTLSSQLEAVDAPNGITFLGRRGTSA